VKQGHLTRRKRASTREKRGSDTTEEAIDTLSWEFDTTSKALCTSGMPVVSAVFEGVEFRWSGAHSNGVFSEAPLCELTRAA
jgi:hypothetical protein